MPVPSQGHYGFHSFPVVEANKNVWKNNNKNNNNNSEKET
jgi:hypothetical protein